MVDALPAHYGFLFPGAENIHNDIYPAINPSTNSSLAQPGKVVLITGGGRGLGRAIALQYAHANVASITLSARTESQLDEAEQAIKKINSNVRVRKLQLDVIDYEAVKKAADLIKKEEGRLDILINNAGYGGPWVKLADADPADWWKTFEVNVKGPFNFVHAFLPLLQETAKTHDTIVDVVNVTSMGGLTVGHDGSSYCSTKLALMRLNEFVTVEYADKGINAVAMHPGGVVTEMSKDIEQVKPFLTDTPELCAGFTVWLTKGQRTWLGGRYVAVSWDVEKLESMKDEIVKEDKLKNQLNV